MFLSLNNPQVIVNKNIYIKKKSKNYRLVEGLNFLFACHNGSFIRNQSLNFKTLRQKDHYMIKKEENYKR